MPPRDSHVSVERGCLDASLPADVLADSIIRNQKIDRNIGNVVR
jgi:hypothetical protein